MKFSAPYDLFDRSLTIVSANPIANIGNDICRYILIETSSDNLGVQLTKSDLDVHITSTTKASVEEQGKVLVHGENLTKILKTYRNLKKSDDCNVVIASDGSRVTVGFSDNKKYKPAILATKDPDYFAPIDSFQNEIASCEIPASNLKDYFTKNLTAISKFESGSEYSGVHFKFKGKDIELVSSNRLEIAIVKATPSSTEYASGITQAFSLIPKKTIDTAIKILRGTDLVRVSISRDMVKISGETEGVQFSVTNSTLMVEAPLDGDAMIPKSSSNIIVIPTSALKNAMSHLEAISERSMANNITICPDEDCVILSCRSNTGEIPGLPVEAKIEKTSGQNCPLILNDHRLISLLKAVKSNNIRIQYNQTGEACTFLGDEEPYFTLIAGSLNTTTIDNDHTTKTISIQPKTESTMDITDYDDLSTISDPDEIEAALEDLGEVSF